jgi:regulator of protease activity HflC (stomatin/prohibitin superfamily)
MAQPKKLEYTALVGLVMQLAFLLACIFLGAKSGSRSVDAESWYVGAGLVVWFVVLIHGRQRRLARQERDEMERLKQTRLSEEIFEETELDRTRASAGLLFFERYLVPFFSVVLSGMLLYFAYRVGIGLWEGGVASATFSPLVAVGMVFFAFAGFLIGKYAAGLAQSPDYRLLRACGGYVLGNVIAAVMIAIAMALYYFELTWAEKVVAYIIPVIMALVGLEILLNLVLDIYRPRVPGQERRPPYDSRLLGLFAEPEGVLKTVAATLDYQFGFRVSETWFYRFMERAILPLLLVQVLSLWLLSCLVVVRQDEVVFIEKCGKPYVSPEDARKGLRATVFEAGFHLKAPWPFSIARHVPAYQILATQVGKIYEPVPGAGPSEIAKDDVILWSEQHINPTEGREVNFLVPSTAEASELGGAAGRGSTEVTGRVPQVNVARVDGAVAYRVRVLPDGRIDPDAAFTFRYRQSDIQEHVNRLATRALCRIAASQDFLKWIAQERGDTVQRLTSLLDEGMKKEALGLEVVFTGIPSVHPAVEAAQAYESIVTALEQKEALAYEGDAESAKILVGATAQAAKVHYEAEGYAAQVRVPAAVQEVLFRAQLAAYRIAPSVYKLRTYMDHLEEALTGQRVFIVPGAAADTEMIDLQPKLRPMLLDLESEK